MSSKNSELKGIYTWDTECLTCGHEWRDVRHVDDENSVCPVCNGTNSIREVEFNE